MTGFGFGAAAAAVWSLERPSLRFGVWSLEFGVWSLEFGVWSLEFGVWSLEFGKEKTRKDREDVLKWKI
ncbi:hypothetical protein BWI96_09220 [Siphonobacter sp. SORGH_AS_0500]|nr:hypothetical protein BWI96_09220 [Siphonobacter sp. SORGH_AS_0500]